MRTEDGDAPQNEARAATKRRRRLSERERLALRAATVRAPSAKAVAVQLPPTVAPLGDELAAAWASADSVPATRMVAMMAQREAIEVGEPHAAGAEATADGATSSDAAAVPVPDSPAAPGNLEPTVGRAADQESAPEAPDLVRAEIVGPTTESGGGEAAVANEPGDLPAEGSCDPEPALPAEAPAAAMSEFVGSTEERGCGAAESVPVTAIPIAPEASSPIGAEPSQHVSQIAEVVAEPQESVDAMEPAPANDAVAADHALEAPDGSDESADSTAPTNSSVPVAEPASIEAESVAVPAELFAFAEVVEPGVAESADAPAARATDSPAPESIVELSAAQVEASRVAEASAAEDVAAMAAIVAAANTDAPTVHEVSLEALEEALTVDESAPPPNHGALTISEAELSALAEPAAENVVAAVEGVDEREPKPESIPAASAAGFTEPAPAPERATEHQAVSVTASDLEVLEAVLGGESMDDGAEAATAGPADLNPTVLAELTRVQEALREVLDAAPTAGQSSAEIHVLKSQLEGLAAEVQSLRIPAPVEPPPTPRQQVVIAAEHLLLVGGGFAMLAWSLASLFSGNQTKLTLLGVIAANLAFAAAILRSGRGTR